MKGLKTLSTPAEEAAANTGFSCLSCHFDVTEALNRLGGNRALFAKLVKSFAMDHESTVAKIAESLKKNDDARARALVHEIRGIAGNLSAYRVEEIAGELGIAIKEGAKSEQKKAFDALSQTFGEMAKAAQSLQYEERASRPGTGANIPADKKNQSGDTLACIRRLDRLLSEFDMDAESCLQDTWPALSKRLSDKELSLIAKAIAALDYRTASEKLKKAAKKAGMDLSRSCSSRY